MTFFSVLLALVLEQLRALAPDNPVHKLFQFHAETVARGLAGRERRHGALAWLMVVLPWTVGTLVVYWLLYRVSFVLAFAWNVVIVYLTLGFRQFSHYYTDISVALGSDDLPRARSILHEWTGLDTTTMPVSEIVRQTLIHAVIGSHRHVFGVFFWFVLPFGPAGAVLYRIAEYLARHWTEPADSAEAVRAAESNQAPAHAFAQLAFFYLDWVPARLTAMGFAIVGNFEDAIYAWRHHLRASADDNDAVLLAAGSGALGVQLGGVEEVASAEPHELVGDVGPLASGEEFTPRVLQSAIGLGWRAVVLWMLLLLMLSAAVWVS